MTLLWILLLLTYISSTCSSPIDLTKTDTVNAADNKRDEAHQSFNLTISIPETTNDFALDCGESRTSTFYCGQSPRLYHCDSAGNVKHNPNVGNQVCDDICRCVNLKPRPGCYVPVASQVICHGDSLKKRELEDNLVEDQNVDAFTGFDLDIVIKPHDHSHAVTQDDDDDQTEDPITNYDHHVDSEKDHSDENHNLTATKQERDNIDSSPDPKAKPDPDPDTEFISHNNTKVYDYTIPTHLIDPADIIDADQLARLTAPKQKSGPDFIRPTAQRLEDVNESVSG